MRTANICLLHCAYFSSPFDFLLTLGLQYVIPLSALRLLLSASRGLGGCFLLYCDFCVLQYIWATYVLRLQFKLKFLSSNNPRERLFSKYCFLCLVLVVYCCRHHKSDCHRHPGYSVQGLCNLSKLFQLSHLANFQHYSLCLKAQIPSSIYQYIASCSQSKLGSFPVRQWLLIEMSLNFTGCS